MPKIPARFYASVMSVSGGLLLAYQFFAAYRDATGHPLPSNMELSLLRLVILVSFILAAFAVVRLERKDHYEREGALKGEIEKLQKRLEPRRVGGLPTEPSIKKWAQWAFEARSEERVTHAALNQLARHKEQGVRLFAQQVTTATLQDWARQVGEWWEVVLKLLRSEFPDYTRRNVEHTVRPFPRDYPGACSPAHNKIMGELNHRIGLLEAILTAYQLDPQDIRKRDG